MKKRNYYYSIPIFISSVLLLLILAIVFSGASYFLILTEMNIFIIIFIWLLYGLLFRDSIPRIIKMGNCVIKNQPALILEPNKLIDNINSNIIPWTEIENIEDFNNPRSGSYIAIKVKNPTSYIDKKKSLYDRIIMRANSRYFNGIFSIKPQMLKCKKSELLYTLKLFLKENGIK